MDFKQFVKPDFITVLLDAASNVVKIIERDNPDVTGEKKKELAIEIILKVYTAADLIMDYPDIADYLIKNMAPVLINAAVDFYNKTGVFTKKAGV
jgi:hypothetical protein